MKLYTDEKLLNKIDYEGSIEAAMEYGITSEKIENPIVAKLWDTAQKALSELDEYLTELRDNIEFIEDDELDLEEDDEFDDEFDEDAYKEDFPY